MLTSVDVGAGAGADAVNESVLGFYCAVARQCFVNEYAYAPAGDEAEQARRLRSALEAALAAGEKCPALWLVVVGAYFPLGALANAAALYDRGRPQSVEALIEQQIKEPAAEQRIAAIVPALTGIDNDVSRAVREQYEESPYPRWVKAGPPAQPSIIEQQSRPVRDILIAGCGTGRFTLEFARQARQARFLAIDLSLASLSYTKRMAQHFDVTNIEFAQADILKMASFGRQFDFIESSGVLHHLADPWQGWRILLAMLRPGGVMQIGLYSELARQGIVAARAMIADRGYRPIPEDIRRCREEIMAAEEGSLLKSVTAWADFFTLSECRDLLFHVQEHRTTLPEIKSFLAANQVQFAGFILDASVRRQFAARFPDREAATDLDCWHVFERDAPQSFAGMYQFWVRKPQ
jgi:2-polyprenyl-3-methyl-5-hydroxy-6-metoxy-1,4-benzoquinol methylase